MADGEDLLKRLTELGDLSEQLPRRITRAVIAARRAGWTYRQIAEPLRTSHVQVLRIEQRAKP